MASVLSVLQFDILIISIIQLPTGMSNVFMIMEVHM